MKCKDDIIHRDSLTLLVVDAVELIDSNCCSNLDLTEAFELVCWLVIWMVLEVEVDLVFMG